jgi:transposase
LSHGVARVGDRLVIRGIVFVIGNGLRPPLPTRGITACIPSKSNRKTPIAHDRVLYRQRHKIENIFGRIKNWRRIHTRYV